MTLDIAYSPCPNDTFIFHAWCHGLVCPEMPVRTALADVQELNGWAVQGRHPVSKISFNCLGHILDDYVMLPSGAALGRACGPMLIAKKPYTLEDLPKLRVAIPGQQTTAHLLMQIIAPEPAQKHFCLYDDITRLLHTDEVDCGLIIHETRFTYEDEGFTKVADLGALWEKRYQSMIPLGCIVAKRDLGAEKLLQINEAIHASLSYAWEHPEASRNYTLEHSQEKDTEVIQSHIDLYVNEESLQLSESGRHGIDQLFAEARQRGLMPPSAHSWLLETAEAR